MPTTDRAFRALARASPDTVRAFVRAATGDADPSAGEAVLLDDPNLDTPPHPKEADLVLRVGDGSIDHYECQGYGQASFLDRLFFYHVALVLRHPQRHVRSWAIWTRVPPPAQRAPVIARGELLLRVTQVVLPEIPAAQFLAHRGTACFAAGAALGDLPVHDLCDRVAEAMGADAPFEHRYLAAMVAASQGRYPEMVSAMERVNMQPVIIEDLVEYGIDQGLARGIEKGRLQAMRQALLDTLDARGLPLDAGTTERIAAEPDPERLRRWCRNAATASALEAVFQG